jgi:hypothetical protein
MNRITSAAVGALPATSVAAGGPMPTGRPTMGRCPYVGCPAKPHHFPPRPDRGPARGKRGGSP